MFKAVTMFGAILGVCFMASQSARADYASPDDFGKVVAAELTKSGSFATCSLEGRDVEDAVLGISRQYAGKFTTSVSIRPYGGDSSSMKACLVITAQTN